MPKPASPIPPGFHTLTVHLVIKGAANYIDFLKRAFGAAELHRSPDPGGKIMHATMRIGDSLVMLADDYAPAFGLPPMAEGRLPFNLQLYFPDADAAWSQAVAAGCEVTMPIGDQFWGDRYGQVRDPYGIVWAIASRKEELSPEELRERAAKVFPGA